MSILDTKHDDTLVDFTFDHELVIDRQSVETTETPIVEKHRRASEGGRVARFFAAMRERNFERNASSYFAGQPALYQDYRAALARRDNTQ
jgi:hypothetical protein